MQDLENNNWIILYPLGNIYEIYAMTTVMTFLNIYHFWNIQFSSDLYEIQIQGNKKVIVYAIAYGPKSTRSPGRYKPPWG